MIVPRVTIVVPSYNHAPFVGEAVASLANQTVKFAKLVVIDDGSSDGSQSILRDLANQYDFVLIEQENRGLAHVLNRALDELVEGDYVVFFASDDICEPDRVERQVAFLDANPEIAMVYGDVWKIDENGSRCGRMVATPARGNRFEDALSGRLLVPPQSTMWRRSVLNSIDRFDPNVRAEDIWLLWNVTRSHQVASLPGVFASYRHHGSQTSRDSRVMITESQRILDRFSAEPCFRAARRSQAKFWFFALSGNDRRGALHYIVPAASAGLDPLFLGGVANLLGLGWLRRPFKWLRDKRREHAIATRESADTASPEAGDTMARHAD